MTYLDIEKVDGSGTPIVFIHGWLGSIESWNFIRQNFELENPMVFYSQRCHGQSECRDFDIEDLANDLEQVTEELEKPILIGHSLGGMTALKYSTISDNFSKLLLLSTSASTPEPRYKSTEFFSEKLGEMPRRKWAELITDNYAEDADQKLKEMSTKELIQADKEALENGLQAMINYNIRNELDDELALVISGINDNAIPREQTKDLSKILNCKHKQIETSHLMLQEKPKEIAQMIEEFVDDV